MTTDLRDKNTYFRFEDIKAYLREYSGAIAYSLNKIDEGDLDAAKTCLRRVVSTGGRIFVAGNGGSAAISDHLTCDFVKGTYTEKHNCLDVHSLVGSQALFTAIGNDLGYEQTFSFQLKTKQVNSNDALILISSSGNSQNIIEAGLYAQSKRATVLGLTGFDGGLLKQMADIKLHVPFNNYGVVEDCHQALMHVLAQVHFCESNARSK